VALNRPSYLSSTFTHHTYGTYWPSRGNDGDKVNCDGRSNANSVAHTQSELNPWFGVDLGVALYVAGVRLTNRENGYRKCASCYYKVIIKRSCFVLARHHCCVTYKPLHDATAAYLVDDCQLVSSRRPSPATIGRHRHVLYPTDQHTVRRPELCSRCTAALEQSAGQDSPDRQ